MNPNSLIFLHDTETDFGPVRLLIPGLTLIEFYSSKYKNSAPLQGWLQRIQNGQITVDGTVTTGPSTRFSDGSRLVYHRLPWKEPDAPYLLEVLYEDDDMIAVNKPSGLQVLPGGLFQQRTVLSQLQWRVRKKTSSVASQGKHPVPVHRLGRGTSGILLCAKTKLAKTRLAMYFADGTSIIGGNRNSKEESKTVRKITKVYRALVHGILEQDEVIINQPIGIVRYPGVAKGLYVASPSGKQALSKVDVLVRDLQENRSMIKSDQSLLLSPGDPLYVSGGQPRSVDSEFVDESFAHDGGYQRPENPVPGDCGYFLHAHQLVLHHPITEKVIKITAPLPSILQTEEEAYRPRERGSVA
ncbi:hypothetical protein CDL15_Pgr026019 [Punica granatum]|uniref:Pseudouridine synthase RsuA/RluA-like domain-containing protein n=1 Tax=Punica granatum TaxID=22663 RepID=A0A218WCD7_PUNGR|nr:hypothetical protein CDL15_Pgr026019 [Punica granatum]